MDDKFADQITEILAQAAPGRPPDAQRLIPLVYDDLRQLAANYLRQGVTTLVAGNCGFSPAPISARSRDAARGAGRRPPLS